MTRQLLAQGVRVTSDDATIWLENGRYYVVTKDITGSFDNLAAARAAFNAASAEKTEE